MASLIPVKGKRGTSYEVQFCDGPDRRPRVRLGRLPKKAAEAAKTRIEYLIAAKQAGHAIDGDTARWLESLTDTIHARLARAGLVPSRQNGREAARPILTLSQLVDRYISRREGNLKPNTVRKYQQAGRALVAYFGENRPLEAITAGDAADWREAMLKSLSEATIATHIKCAKSFFAYAVDSELIASNPLSRVKAGSQKNGRRKVFVPASDIEKVLAVCPDCEWRLIVALARYGGLRIPSELQELAWSDVKWAANRIVIHTKKKEHIAGHECREIPIFPELRPYLEEAYQQAAPGTVYVTPRARQSGVNLRTQFERLLRKAGVKQWTRLFQNLRASRQTELARQYPLHLVTLWIGNSQQVAQDHYLMPTDADYEQASQTPVQIPVQSAPFPASQERSEARVPPIMPASRYYTGVQLPPAGIEPATYGLGNRSSIH